MNKSKEEIAKLFGVTPVDVESLAKAEYQQPIAGSAGYYPVKDEPDTFGRGFDEADEAMDAFDPSNRPPPARMACSLCGGTIPSDWHQPVEGERVCTCDRDGGES